MTVAMYQVEIKCPGCGNDNLGEMTYFIRNETAHRIRRRADGRIEADHTHPDVYSSVGFYCSRCPSEIASDVDVDMADFDGQARLGGAIR